MKGQISIEFLLVFCAVLSFLAIFASAFSEIENSSRFALDVQSAKRFSADLSNASEKLSFFCDKTSIEFRYKIFNEWELSEQSLFVRADSKTFEIPIPENIIFEESSFFGKVVFTLEKIDGKLFLS